MKTYLVSNPNAQFGYQVEVVNDDGTTEVMDVLNIQPNGSLHLPENPSNRQYMMPKAVDKANGRLELTYKATRTLGSRKAGTSKTPTPKSSWVDVLTDDERQLYDELKAKAEKRLARKAIEDEIAALKAKLEEVEGE